ncbi:hypothetical protein [Nonomuraea sp. NPDC003201]
MKIVKIAVLTCVLMTPLAGTAAAATAYPVKHPKLIANPLYDAGVLPTTTCEEPPLKRNNRQLGRAYINAMLACLETTWEQHLTSANLPYRPVKARHVDKIPNKYCGATFDQKDDSEAYYCEKTGTLTFEVGKEYLDDPTDLWMLYQVGYMYSYHVQHLTGIADAYNVVRYRNKSELQEQQRRDSLQRDCLAAAFIKSVWPLTGRTGKDWSYFLTLPGGDTSEKDRRWGKTSSIGYWLKRGFATADPASCNTWTAASAKVA